MSRRNGAPRAAWFVAGVCVAVLLVPTTVGAVAALKYTGIEGSSTNKADVSPNGQLLTTQADPSSYFSVNHSLSSQSSAPIYIPAAGTAAVVRSLHVDVWGLSGSDPYLGISVGDPTCTNQLKFLDEVDPSSNGDTVLPYDPGQVIPAGDALCIETISLSASATAVGYSIPAASAPTLPADPVRPASLKH